METDVDVGFGGTTRCTTPPYRLTLALMPRQIRPLASTGFRASLYLGLQPGRRNSGQSEPQMHISRKATRICELCWCKGHSTFWDHLERIAICGAGD